MLWERVSATEQLLQVNAEQIAETVRQVGELSGAVRELSANDAAHTQRFDQLTQDMRDMRQRQERQQDTLGDLKADIAKAVGESVQVAITESRAVERHSNALFDAIAERSNSILWGLVTMALGGCISWVIFHH